MSFKRIKKRVKSPTAFRNHERNIMNKRITELNCVMNKKISSLVHQYGIPCNMLFNFHYPSISVYLNKINDYEKGRHKDDKQKWWNNQKASEMSKDFLPSILDKVDEVARQLCTQYVMQLSNYNQQPFSSILIHKPTEMFYNLIRFELLDTCVNSVFSTQRSGSNEIFLRTSFQYAKAQLRKKLQQYFSDQEMKDIHTSKRKKKDTWLTLIKNKKEFHKQQFQLLSTNYEYSYNIPLPILQTDIQEYDYNHMPQEMSMSMPLNNIIFNDVHPPKSIQRSMYEFETYDVKNITHSQMAYASNPRFEAREPYYEIPCCNKCTSKDQRILLLEEKNRMLSQALQTVSANTSTASNSSIYEPNTNDNVYVDMDNKAREIEKIEYPQLRDIMDEESVSMKSVSYLGDKNYRYDCSLDRPIFEKKMKIPLDENALSPIHFDISDVQGVTPYADVRNCTPLLSMPYSHNFHFQFGNVNNTNNEINNDSKQGFDAAMSSQKFISISLFSPILRQLSNENMHRPMASSQSRTPSFSCI